MSRLLLSDIGAILFHVVRHSLSASRQFPSTSCVEIWDTRWCAFGEKANCGTDRDAAIGKLPRLSRGTKSSSDVLATAEYGHILPHSSKLVGKKHRG